MESLSHLFATSLSKIHTGEGSTESLKKILQQKASYFWKSSQDNTRDNSDFFSYTECVELQDLLKLLEDFRENDRMLIKQKAQKLGNEVYRAVLAFINEPLEDLSGDEEW